MRDPLNQYIQSAHDPAEPATEDSIRRARQFQRTERAKELELLIRANSPLLDARLWQYFTEDPGIVSALSVRVAARLAVRQRNGWAVQ